MINKLRQIGRLLWAIITLPYGVYKVHRIAAHAIQEVRGCHSPGKEGG